MNFNGAPCQDIRSGVNRDILIKIILATKLQIIGYFHSPISPISFPCIYSCLTVFMTRHLLIPFSFVASNSSQQEDSSNSLT